MIIEFGDWQLRPYDKLNWQLFRRVTVPDNAKTRGTAPPASGDGAHTTASTSREASRLRSSSQQSTSSGTTTGRCTRRSPRRQMSTSASSEPTQNRF